MMHFFEKVYSFNVVESLKYYANLLDYAVLEI